MASQSGNNPNDQDQNQSPEYPPPASTTNTAPPRQAQGQYAGWQSIQNGDWNKAWVDYVQQKYGQAARGAGFANLPSGGLGQAVNEFNNDTGANATFNGDTVDFGNGTKIDAVTNYHGQGPQYLWSSAGGQRTGNYSEGGDGSSGAGGAGGGGGNGSPGVGGGPWGSYGSSSGSIYSSPQNDQLIQLLMGRANQSLKVDPNDPIIKGQVDSFRAEQDRERRNNLNDLAESSSPYATGAQQTAATQTAEKASQATSSMQSQLMQNELTSRRTEIQNALSELGSVLTADQQMALQRELGLIDASLRQQQITSNNDQFAANLGLNAQDRKNYWDAVNSGRISG